VFGGNINISPSDRLGPCPRWSRPRPYPSPRSPRPHPSHRRWLGEPPVRPHPSRSRQTGPHRRRDRHTRDDAVSVAATRPAMIARIGRTIAALIVSEHRERNDREQVEEAEGVRRRNSTPEPRGAARTVQNTPHGYGGASGWVLLSDMYVTILKYIYQIMHFFSGVHHGTTGRPRTPVDEAARGSPLSCYVPACPSASAGGSGRVSA
jgi:hypothetical protein